MSASILLPTVALVGRIFSFFGGGGVKGDFSFLRSIGGGSFRLHFWNLQAGPSMMWFFYAYCPGSMRIFFNFPAWLAQNRMYIGGAACVHYLAGE